MNDAMCVPCTGALIGFVLRVVGALSLGCALTVQAQMSTPGQFAVSNGAATYEIPIQLPPGIAGVQPALALAYGSQSGNGLLGVGWNLSGLSNISRCPRALAQDNYRGAVNYDLNDRYCMGGKRLMAISGADGGNLTEYRTEIESFTRITSYAETGATNGPGSFIVKTNAGLTMEFGKTADSRIEVPGKTVVAEWALNKVYDTKGNFYTVSYTENNANGEYYPIRIDYTGNAGSTPSVSTQSAVIFDYETRPDIAQSYHAGALFKTTVRLAKVRTTYQSVGVFNYTLTYQAAGQLPTPTLSTLKSLQQCSVTSSKCMPSIQLGLDTVMTPAYGIVSTTSADQCLVSCGFWLGGDINGDGKSDYAHVANDSGLVITLFSNGNGTYGSTAYSSAVDTCLISCGNWQVGDLNADGRTDLIHLANNSGLIMSWLSNGDGTYQVRSFSSAVDTCLTCGTWTTADMDGDGRTDLIHISNDSGAVFTWFSNGDGSFRVVPYSSVGDTCLVSCGGWRSGDIDGDGKMDLVHIVNDTGLVISWLSNGDGQYRVVSYTAPDTCLISCGSWQVGDLNGDGKMDLVHIANNTGTVLTWLSKGDGSYQVVGYNSTVDTCLVGCGAWRVGDVNGDGESDLMHIANNTGSIFTWLSKGDGTYQVGIYTSSADTCLISCGTWQVGDINGDGKTDLVHFANDSGLLVTWKSLFGAPSHVISVSDGVGAGVSAITYNTLPQLLGTRYVRDLVPTYPFVAPVPATPVVTDVSSSNGVGGVSTTSYAYANLLADIGSTGRGMLGFQWVQSKDVSTGVVSRTYYRQDWPYVGLVDKSGKGTSEAGWNNLMYTVNSSFTCSAIVGTAAGVPCTTTGTNPTVKSGSRYFIYPNQMDTQAWDYTGTTATDGIFIALPRTRTTQTLDDYGNATTVKVETLNPDGSASGYSKTTTSVFAPTDTTNWYLGRLIRSSVTATAP